MIRRKEAIHVLALAGVAVLLLAAYLGLRGRDRIQYRLPQFDAIDTASIDQIRIDRRDEEIIVARESEGWVLLPQGYEANSASIEPMLDALAELRLSELVSVTGRLARYDLDPEEAVTVTAYRDETVQRSIVIGKQAPTYFHTYVKLPDDSRVFQTEGDLRSIFATSADQLRDKSVLTFDAEEIRRIEAEVGGERIVVSRSTEPAAPESQDEPAEVWTDEAGAPWDDSKVRGLLNRASALNALRFEDRERGAVAADITFHGERPYRLTIYEKDDRVHPASTSQSDYPFLLSTWQAEAIIEAFERDEE